MYYSTKAKLSSLWNKAGRPKSAEMIKSIINCQLTLPCITRWNSFYDSLVKLYKIDRDKLNKLMYELDLPEFTKSDFEFIYEYIKVTKHIAIALDSLQGDIDAFYGNLIPTLFGIKSKITNINKLKYCDALVKALLNSLQTRFATYLNLEL